MEVGVAASSGLTRILPGILRWGPVPAGVHRAGRGTAPAWHRVAWPAWARTAIWPAELLSVWSWAGEPAGGREQGRGPQRGQVGTPVGWDLGSPTPTDLATLRELSQEGRAQVPQGLARGSGLWAVGSCSTPGKENPRGSPTPISTAAPWSSPSAPGQSVRVGRGCKEMAQQSGRC